MLRHSRALGTIERFKLIIAVTSQWAIPYFFASYFVGVLIVTNELIAFMMASTTCICCVPVAFSTKCWW